MITAVDLFERSVITGKEEKMLEAANKTAQDIYEKRDESPWKEELGANPCLEVIEHYVIKTIQVSRKNHEI